MSGVQAFFDRVVSGRAVIKAEVSELPFNFEPAIFELTLHLAGGRSVKLGVSSFALVKEEEQASAPELQVIAVAALVKQERMRRGLTVEELAAVLGVGEATIYMLETTSYMPKARIPEALTVLKACGVPDEALLVYESKDKLPHQERRERT